MDEKKNNFAAGTGAEGRSDARPAAPRPISFVTDDGATVTITLDPEHARQSPGDAMVKARDAVRCLADAFSRAERRATMRPDEAGAVFRSWAYRP